MERKDIVLPMIPAKERTAIVIKTRRNGLSERREKEVVKEKVKVKAKAKEKESQKETGTGKETARNYLAPTTTKGMATVSGATTVDSPTMALKGVSASTRPWPRKALPRNKRKK